jgi:hypothetical protein
MTIAALAIKTATASRGLPRFRGPGRLRRIRLDGGVSTWD